MAPTIETILKNDHLEVVEVKGLVAGGGPSPLIQAAALGYTTARVIIRADTPPMMKVTAEWEAGTDADGAGIAQMNDPAQPKDEATILPSGESTVGTILFLPPWIRAMEPGDAQGNLRYYICMYR